MSRAIKSFLVFFFIGGLSALLLAQDNRQPPLETGKTKGFDVVFVVDVSPGEKAYAELLLEFVEQAYNAFAKERKNGFHLVTFTDNATLFKTGIDKNSLLDGLKSQIPNKTRSANFKHGLDEVFGLVADSFPLKVGIVLFISSGDESRFKTEKNRGGLKRTIQALKRNGFTVFSIFLSAGIRGCKDCMEEISQWSHKNELSYKNFFEIDKEKDIRSKVDSLTEEALKIVFSSPAERIEINSLKEDIENIKAVNLNSDEELRGEIYTRDKKNNRLLFFLLASLGVLVTFTIFLIFMYRTNRLVFIFSRKKVPLVVKDEKKSSQDLIKPPFNDINEENWLPEYPTACRCKDRIDIREVIAFDTVGFIIEKRRPSRAAAPIRWLDLCCGNGNILSQFGESHQDHMPQVEYYGYDIDRKNIDECREIIRKNNLDRRLAHVKVEVVNLDISPIPGKKKFDIITLLNVLHEINPFNIFSLLKKAMERCKKNGVILIVDMCCLPHLEWKAATWTKEGLKELVSYFLRGDKETCNIKESTCEIAVYPKKVEVFSLRLWRNKVEEKLIDIWDQKQEEKKQKKIIFNYLKKKKEKLARQLYNIYDERSNIKDEKGYKNITLKILWEYWWVCEILLNKSE